MHVPLFENCVMRASPKVGEEHVKIAEMRMKSHMSQIKGMNQQEELRRQIEEIRGIKTQIIRAHGDVLIDYIKLRYRYKKP